MFSFLRKQNDKEKAAILSAVANDTGLTSLMVAAMKGNVDRVQALLSDGVDMKAKDKNGVTALMYATSQGHIEVVKALIAHGANVDAKDNDGATALILAKKAGYTEISRLLDQFVSKLDKFHAVAEAGGGGSHQSLNRFVRLWRRSSVSSSSNSPVHFS